MNPPCEYLSNPECDHCNKHEIREIEVLRFKDGLHFVMSNMDEDEERIETRIANRSPFWHFHKNIMSKETKERKKETACWVSRPSYVYYLRDKNGNNINIFEDKKTNKIKMDYLDIVFKLHLVILEGNYLGQTTFFENNMKLMGYKKVSFPHLLKNKSNLLKGNYIKENEKEEYDDNIEIFYDFNEACNYTGNKIPVYKGDVGLWDYKKLKSFGKLNSISGSCNFYDSNIEDLGNLESIWGNAYFSNHRKLKSTQNLKIIGGSAGFNDSGISILKNLTYIGKDAIFSKSKISSLNKLSFVGENLIIEKEVNCLGELKEVGGSLYSKKSSNTSLNNLERIGVDAFFGKKLKDLGKLSDVNGRIFFDKENTIIKKQLELRNLPKVKGLTIKPWC